VFVQLVRISNSRGIEGLGRGDQGPESCTIHLSDDIVGNPVAPGVPTSRDLASNSSTELEGLGNVHTGTLLELCEPLTAFGSPDVALIAVLQLELLRLRVRDLDGLEIVEKFDLLVEDLLVRVIASEELRF